MIIIFLLTASLVCFTWIGYPFLLLIFSKLIPHTVEKGSVDTFVTVLVTVHNEEKIIAQRISNILDTEYPLNLLEVIVASDGSTDRTNTIVSEYHEQDSRVRLFTTAGGGKSFTQVKVVDQTRGEIVILTDAETLFQKDTIKDLVRPFEDTKVGCTTGRLVLTSDKNGVAESQGFYWRYEMLLRKLESRTGLLHTASGSIMAFRKSLFRPFESKYGDDCVIPLDIVSQGYRVVHAEDAVAYDAFPSTVQGELKARIRMTLRNVTCTLSRYNLLNPFKFPLISLAILSHKLLRWLTPYFMVLLFVSNIFLLDGGRFFLISLWGQVSFYLLGIAGYFAERRSYRIPLASQAFSFILANVGFFIGVFQAILGKNIISYQNIKKTVK